ncbi:Ig-like domain-containing protein [Terriglobus sp.]|uniref:Ig-like domain-containing protein n=1 Tax=Terriglobus sp. TaxID=1889013 RepID=UPI003B004B49
MRAVTLRFPEGTVPSSVKARLNGKDVSALFQEQTCTGAICLSGNLATADGVVPGENVISATARNQDGTASSSRMHFSGDASVEANSRRPQPSARAMAATVQIAASNLPTNSTFLPPSVLFQTLSNGGVGAGQPWFRLGSLQQVLNGSCTSPYSVIVLDRRTLEQKTAAPESSPQCFAGSSTLTPYLASLTGNNDIVIVGTNQGQTTDAGSQSTSFDTTTIGGTLYNCPNCAAKAGTVHSNDIPLTYLAIGVPGAAGGSAYENYTSSAHPGSGSFATGMFVEDATGNYNFQSANNVEFVVSPGSTIANTSATITNAPGSPGTTVVYGPPNNATNGFWLLVLDRNSLDSVPTCTGSFSGSVYTVPNCGTLFPLSTGGGDPMQIQAMANALNNVNSNQIAILTTVGTAGWGNPAAMASDNKTPNNMIAVALALQSYGIPDKSILYTGLAGSAWTMVGTPGLGGPLNGHNLLSASYFSQQGHTGYLHGTFARDSHGLYEPSHSEQQKSGADTANLQLGLITSQQPQEWPEYATLSGATSVAGQVDAYEYLSWYLLNGWYLQGQAASTTSADSGVTGKQQYDIHYFFTGSLNTLLDYHTFDPLDAIFPAGVQPGHRNIPCKSTSGTSPVTCNWTGPDGTKLQFTSDDFAAVQVQLHNELVALNNVLTFMVTGSTNMKDVVAAGNSNAALALLQALADVQANINQPPPPSAPVTVSPWHIMHMIGSDVSPFISFATDGVISASDIALADKAIGFVGDLFNAAGGTGGGLNTVDKGVNKQIPRLDYKLDIAIGQLATTDLQGAILAGFDSTLDVVTGDYGKLMALGGTPASNSPLFAPTQATQNQVIQMITKASQKSLYTSLIPQIYQVHEWAMSGSANLADMGYTSSGDTNSCRAFYNVTTTPWIAAAYPTYGGTTYHEAWQSGGNGQNAGDFWPYFYNSNPPFIDWYILSLPFNGAGSTGANAMTMDGTLSGILFGADQNSVNFVRDEFVAEQGPMDKPLTGNKGSLVNMAFEVSNFHNAIGLDNYHVCSAAQLSAVQSGTTSQVSRDTATILRMPGSAVLGENVLLHATVTISSSSTAASGSVQLREGVAVLATVPLDASGSASYTAKGLAIGEHAITAYYIPSDSKLPSDSGPQLLTVYANAPEMQLMLSQSTLTVTYGKTSSPVSLTVLALSGMNGTVNYACSGLPAGMTCAFSPTSSTIANGKTATTSFTISGTPVTASSAALAFGKGWTLLFSTALLMFLLRSFRHGGKMLDKIIFPLLLLTLAVGGMLGCGGSTRNKDTTFQETGAKSVLVIATSGNLTRATPLVVNIR